MSNVQEQSSTIVNEIEAMERAVWQPTYQIVRSSRGVTYSFDLPGVLEANSHVACRNGRLWIWGYRAAGPTGEISTRMTGAFAVDAPLAEKLDPKRILKSIERGVLTVYLPNRRASIHRP